MSLGSEIEVSRAPHESVHVYQWNCLSLVPFLISLYIHYFSDCHVFHGFPVIGCLQNDQQPNTPDQIQKISTCYTCCRTSTSGLASLASIWGCTTLYPSTVHP